MNDVGWPAPSRTDPDRRRSGARVVIAVLGMTVLMLDLAAIMTYQNETFEATNPYNWRPARPDAVLPEDAKVTIIAVQGSLGAGECNWTRLQLGGQVLYSLRVELAFTDEPVASRLYQNLPDTLGLEVELPDRTFVVRSVTGSVDEPGLIVIDLDWTTLGGLGLPCTTTGVLDVLDITVTSLKVGAIEPKEPILDPFHRYTDPGTPYTMLIEWVVTD